MKDSGHDKERYGVEAEIDHPAEKCWYRGGQEGFLPPKAGHDE